MSLAGLAKSQVDQPRADFRPAAPMIEGERTGQIARSPRALASAAPIGEDAVRKAATSMRAPSPAWIRRRR